jgi:hypothetical protein
MFQLHHQAEQYAANQAGANTPEWKNVVQDYNSGGQVDPRYDGLLQTLNDYYRQGQATPGKLTANMGPDAVRQWGIDSSPNMLQSPENLAALTAAAIGYYQPWQAAGASAGASGGLMGGTGGGASAPASLTDQIVSAGTGANPALDTFNVAVNGATGVTPAATGSGLMDSAIQLGTGSTAAGTEASLANAINTASGGGRMVDPNAIPGNGATPPPTDYLQIAKDVKKLIPSGGSAGGGGGLMGGGNSQGFQPIDYTQFIREGQAGAQYQGGLMGGNNQSSDPTQKYIDQLLRSNNLKGF